MASRIATDPRKWSTFYGSISKDGTRYRHQCIQNVDKSWCVRTEVWEDSDVPTMPYYTAAVPVSHEDGHNFFHNLRHQFSNLTEHENPMYPVGYESGFQATLKE
jgi:hypothetical protein